MLDPNVFLQNPAPDFKMNQLCKVCGEPAAGFHFGAFTCEGCKSFFGRTYNNVSGIAECKNGGRCEINKKNRTSCKSCRLRKCLRVGMSKSGSRYGRRSNWFKIHCLLQAQGQQNGINSSPETNNNSSSTTNNNPSPNYSIGKSQLPSTVTSSFGGSSGDRGERERSTPSSTASRNGGSGHNLPGGFTSLSHLSPESLSSLNRKLAGSSSDLSDYFRAAGLAKGSSSCNNEDERDRGDDNNSTRTTRSPGSLESPRSDTSMDDVKPHHGLPFGLPMPPGSPLDVKPNDLLSFDLITRDLMKMGYDPLRLWPAMFTAGQPSLHSFNPYRFMFPNFPGAGAFPGGAPFPPTHQNPTGIVPPQLLNGLGLPGAKLFPEGIPSPLANLPNNLTRASHSPTNTRSSPTLIRSRVPLVPPSTLTPPISHHGSDDPSSGFPKHRVATTPAQEKPIDLSAKATNNNVVDYKLFNGQLSEDEDMCDNDSCSESEFKLKPVTKYDDNDEESEGDDVVEDLSSSSNNNNVSKKLRRSSSCSSSSSSSPKRAITPLDLTRGGSGSNSNNSSPPLPTTTKIAT